MASMAAITHPDVLSILSRLGERIRTARIRRRLRQEDLATITGLSRSSIKAIERGDPGCSIGILVRVLWDLGLTGELELIADPGLDRDGLTVALSTETKRVFVPKKARDDF